MLWFQKAVEAIYKLNNVIFCMQNIQGKIVKTGKTGNFTLSLA